MQGTLRWELAVNAWLKVKTIQNTPRKWRPFGKKHGPPRFHEFRGVVTEPTKHNEVLQIPVKPLDTEI